MWPQSCVRVWLHLLKRDTNLGKKVQRWKQIIRQPDCGTICSDAVLLSLACVEERALSASVGLILLRKKENFLLLCVWVSWSVTSRSKVDFL